MTIAASILFLVFTTALHAQPPEAANVHQPLNHRLPPGTAGYWAGMTGKATAGYFQPLRIELPSRGRVGVYSAGPSQFVEIGAPAQFGAAAGYTYRLRIREMPEFPGIELYPSIEVIDRLHPPPGKRDEFPIPVEFTFEEIQFALAHRMVTKVVYLEQPQLAVPADLQKPLSAITLPASRNLLAEADRLGRPLVIIRLGGRLPVAHGENAAFFGAPSPFRRPREQSPSQPQETSSRKPPGSRPTALGRSENATAGAPHQP